MQETVPGLFMGPNGECPPDCQSGVYKRTGFCYHRSRMMPGSKGQKAVHACMIRLLNLGPAKHEKAAIYAVNQRISNVYRIAGAALQRSNS